MNEYKLLSILFKDSIPININNNILDVLYDAKLTDKELLILILRFGLVSGRVKTLEEVAKYYSVTRERIRIIESKALSKIRQYLEPHPLIRSDAII